MERQASQRVERVDEVEGRTPERDEPQEARDQAAATRTSLGEIQLKYGGPAEVPASEVQDTAAAGIAGPATTMPHLAAVQASFGPEHDLSGVQAHVGSEATTAARGLGAEAYATGNHVAFAGAPSLHTAAHEAAHVVQQQQGVHRKATTGEASDALEQQADQVADQVVAGESAAALLDDATDKAPKDAKAKKFKPGTPADFATATARHEANLALLDSLLQAGKSEKDSKWGKSWPNACQWLLAGKTTLHALTETHDSLARATQQGDASMRAFFGIDTVVPGKSTYNELDMTDATNIDLNNPSWLGYRQAGSPSKIAIIDPVTKNKELVKETIVHEVQHDADHHGAGDFENYRTEFDAYWIDKTFGEKSSKTGTADDSLAASDGVVLSGFDNARQQAIFLHLYESGSYAFVKAQWGVAAFKAQVLAFKFPHGINLVDSVRIDDLYLELTKAPPDIAEAKKKLKLLNGHDRAAIVSPAMIDAWRTVIATLTDPADQSFFTTELVL